MLIYDPRCKRIGSYLIDAGILSQDQVDVILVDQEHSDLKFGEIAAVRGWVSSETVEFLHEKIIEPERVIGTPLKPGHTLSVIPMPC